MLNKILSVNPETRNSLNSRVAANYARLKPSLFLLPLILVVALVLFLYHFDAISTGMYIQIQKDLFYFLNSKLSQFPNLIYNLTQLGDALVFLSLLSILILYAPKMWEALLSASLVSAILSGVLKNFFAVPRPAAAFDQHSFVIIGKALTGHNSLPSGHSITIFTALTVLMFAFMPKKISHKILWSFFITVTGLMLVFTRVGVGAHYPLDVITGSLVGCISGLAGIFITKKYKIWNWISNRKYHPIFILLFLICCISIIHKITDENLIIYYLALLGLLVSLFKLTYKYVKK